jgi:hypothetical protein
MARCWPPLLILSVIVYPHSGQAQTCPANQHVQQCVRLTAKYPRVRIFYFSQKEDTVYQFVNDCSTEVRLISRFANGAQETRAVALGGTTDIIGSVSNWVACGDTRQIKLNPPPLPPPVKLPPPAPQQVMAPPVAPVLEPPIRELTPHTPPVPPAFAAVPPEAGYQAIERFNTRANRDIWGYDIAFTNGRPGVSALDINACATLCDKDAACVAFSYDRWRHKCYPKGTIATSLLDPSSTIAVRRQFELPNVSTAQSKMQDMRNVRFRDEPITRETVSSFGACKAVCEGSLRCVAFSFLKLPREPQNCLTFNNSGGFNPDDSADSGYKYQSP